LFGALLDLAAVMLMLKTLEDVQNPHRSAGLAQQPTDASAHKAAAEELHFVQLLHLDTVALQPTTFAQLKH
jgi:hypothetical protein